MKKLYIIGARGCGREVYTLFLECKESLPNVECVGFLDDNKAALDGFEGYPPIVSAVEDFIPSENDVFICALGDPRWIKHYTQIIENKNGKFISLISPYSSICMNTTIGEGSIISRWAIISPDVTIGKHSSIGVFSNLGHDVVVGDCCHLGAYTFMGGYSIVDSCVTCHPRVNILPHKKVGENSIVGAGSVVIKNVSPNTTVFGVPAKKVFS